jgi:hypothetical protein
MTKAHDIAEYGFDASPYYGDLDKVVSRNDLDAFAWAVLNAYTAAMAGQPQSPRVSGLETPPELLALIDRAKNHVMSAEEIYEQRRSFIRGMCPSNRDYEVWCETVDKMFPPLSVTRPDRNRGEA